jgi:hypothetical protein
MISSTERLPPLAAVHRRGRKEREREKREIGGTHEKAKIIHEIVQ